MKLKKTAVAVAAVVAAGCVLVFSDGMRRGVRQGLELCGGSVIPSLFLFTAVALFISYSGAADALGRLLEPVTRRVLGLSGAAATAWLLSMVSGYPVGARLIGSLYENGSVSRAKALKMLTFSVNAGPAFIVVAVGSSMLGSASDGRRLLLAHLLATCLIALSARFLPDRFFSETYDKPTTDTAAEPTAASISDAFVSAVSDAGRTMLTVCTFVVFFAGVGGMLTEASLPYGNQIKALLEVTVGLSSCTRGQLPFAAFLLGFGGVSVIFQVKSAAGSLRPPLLLITLSRLIHGALSAGVVVMAEALFPRSVATGSFGVQADSAAVHTSPFAAAALMGLCVVLLVFTHNARQKNNG